MKLSKQETIKGLAEVIYANQDEAGEFLSSTSRLDDIDLEDLIKYLNSNNITSSLKYTFSVGEKFLSENYEAELEQTSGGEGDGAEIFCVFRVKRLSDNAQGYIEFAGRYSSWDSSYYNSSYCVEPQEVMIIQYNTI